MIHILDWNYEAEGSILELLRGNDWESVQLMADSLGMTKNVFNKQIKKLKDKGLLVSHRYRDNNMIWLIGGDAIEKWSPWEALQIAKYRRCVSLGEDQTVLDAYSDDERNLVLEGVGIFPEEKTLLSGTPKEYHAPRSAKEQAHFEKINAMLKAKSHPVSQKLTDYVDVLWENYKSTV